MHRALLIDELIRGICCHVGSEPGSGTTFSRMAIICRAWKDPALDFLWESLPSTRPLLGILPPLTYEDGAPNLATNLSPEDLANFSTYASRVRAIKHSCKSYPKLSSNALAQLISLEPGKFLLPSLSEVQVHICDAEKRAFIPSVYLSDCLRSVSIDVGFARRGSAKESAHPGASVRAYIGDVVRTAPGLHQLTVRGQVDEMLLGAVAEMKSLRSLSLLIGSSMTPQTLVALGALEHLESLRLQLDNIDVELMHEALDGSNALFSALRSLDVRASPSILVPILQRFPNESRLTSVKLESDLKPRAVDAWTPVFEILVTKAARTLCEISIQSLTSFCEVPDMGVPPQLHFTVEVLSPLSRVANLRHFSLDASVPADLNDADVVKISRWWPKIEHLGLWTRPAEAFDYPTYFTLQPRVTLMSLQVLAKACPSLRSLAIPISVSLDTPAEQNPCAHSVLRSMTVGCAKRAEGIDSESLAKFMFDTFPSMSLVDFDCAEEGMWMDVTNAYFTYQKKETFLKHQ